MMTRKHYKAIAEILNRGFRPINRKSKHLGQINLDITTDLAIFFKLDNPNFKKEKFLNAVGFFEKDIMLGHDSDPRFGDILK